MLYWKQLKYGKLVNFMQRRSIHVLPTCLNNAVVRIRICPGTTTRIFRRGWLSMFSGTGSKGYKINRKLKVYVYSVNKDLWSHCSWMHQLINIHDILSTGSSIFMTFWAPARQYSCDLFYFETHKRAAVSFICSKKEDNHLKKICHSYKTVYEINLKHESINIKY